MYTRSLSEGSAQMVELPLSAEGYQAQAQQPGLTCRTYRSFSPDGSSYDQTQCTMAGASGYYDAHEILQPSGASTFASDVAAHTPAALAAWQAQLDADTAAQLARMAATGDSPQQQFCRQFPFMCASQAELQQAMQTGTTPAARQAPASDSQTAKDNAAAALPVTTSGYTIPGKFGVPSLPVSTAQATSAPVTPSLPVSLPSYSDITAATAPLSHQVADVLAAVGAPAIVQQNPLLAVGIGLGSIFFAYWAGGKHR